MSVIKFNIESESRVSPEFLVFKGLLILKNRVENLIANLIDNNINELSWWLKKHKTYAIREAINYLSIKNNSQIDIKLPTDNTKLNKYYKIKIYYRLPIFFRPLLLFSYNYFIKFGFL